MSAKADYSIESNIAKSISKYLHDVILTTWNLTGKDKQFFTRYPTGEFKRPSVCIEYQNARKLKGNVSVGLISKERIYKITVFGPVNPATLNPEEMLEQYKNQIEEQLDENEISYYRYDFLGVNPPRTGSFRMEYVSDEIVSELVQKDKNLWTIIIKVT